jgi:oligopeptide/dipeptide ABC transporter ATP-binding protein
VAVNAPALAGSPARALLSARGLVKTYRVRGTAAGSPSGRQLAAVDGVSFEIPRGSTLALAGESGSGKTTIGRLVARLERPDAGEIEFDGEDWLALSGADLRRKRRDLQVVFQDPFTSLNPRMRVGDQIAEPLRVQRLIPRSEVPRRVGDLLVDVGLDRGASARFPSELSGGQRQRIAIARALATRPKLVVCDEPVSALDASIGAQIVNLLVDLQRGLGLSYLFISHDIALVSQFADRLAVVYLGRIVEEGPPEAIVRTPLHPYTAALVSAVPDPDPRSAAPRIALPESSEANSLPAARGCAFAPRCPIAADRCRETAPGLVEAAPGHRVACFYPGEVVIPALAGR